MKIRKARHGDVPAIAKVHVDAWLETYRGLIPDAYLDRLTYGKRERLWQENMENSNILVAENDQGQVFGFATWVYPADTEKGKAELSSIYILQEYHRLGVGRALLHAVFQGAKTAGCRRLDVKVLSLNPACSFYEATGAEKVDQLTITIHGECLEETVYSWELNRVSFQ